MTRLKALEIFNLCIDDLNGPDAKMILNSKFKKIIKEVHPDTSDGVSSLTTQIVVEAKNVLTRYINESVKQDDSSMIFKKVCPKCNGTGLIKILKGFTVATEICSCEKKIK